MHKSTKHTTDPSILLRKRNHSQQVRKIYSIPNNDFLENSAYEVFSTTEHLLSLSQRCQMPLSTKLKRAIVVRTWGADNVNPEIWRIHTHRGFSEKGHSLFQQPQVSITFSGWLMKHLQLMSFMFSM